MGMWKSVHCGALASSNEAIPEVTEHNKTAISDKRDLVNIISTVSHAFFVSVK